MKIEISDGDIIDKFTILEIKKRKVMNDRIFLNKVKNEQLVLMDAYQDIKKKIGNNIINQLRKINNNLWKAEDDIRNEEILSKFDANFINLARSILRLNDERTLIKLKINSLTHSSLRNTKKIYKILK